MRMAGMSDFSHIETTAQMARMFWIFAISVRPDAIWLLNLRWAARRFVRRRMNLAEIDLLMACVHYMIKLDIGSNAN
jgi:hypothetical protein